MICKLNFEHSYILLLALLPILDQYKFFGMTFEMIFGVFGLAIIILNRGKLKDNNKFYNEILFLLIYTVIILLIQGIRLEVDPFQMLFRIGLYVLITMGICFVTTDVCTFLEFKNIYEKIVIILSLITIFQFLLYTFTGRATMLLFPGLDLNYSTFNSTEYSAETLSRLSYGWYYRPCSLFLEPAHHAQYVMPWLFLEVLSIDTSEGRRLANCIIVSIGLLLTASSLGVLGCTIAWLMAFIRWSSKMGRRALIRNFAFLCLVIVLAGVFYRVPAVQFYFNMKMKELTADNWGSNSFTMRMVRGFACFSKFSIPDKIFGCGYGNILQYLTTQNISTIYDARMGDLSYMNGAATLLCSYGIIGTIYYIYVFFARKFIFNWTYLGLICSMGIIMLTSAVFNTPTYYIGLALILLFQIDNKRETRQF